MYTFNIKNIIKILILNKIIIISFNDSTIIVFIILKKELKMVNKSKYTGNCSIKGVAKKFKELKYMTDISHTVSTGNKKADKAIAKVGAGILSKVVKKSARKSHIIWCKNSLSLC